MEEIKIYDNMFDLADINSILNFFEKTEWVVNKPQSICKTFGDLPFGRKELMDNDFFSIYLKNKIEEKVNKKMVLNRIYAVSQTFGQDSNYHTDNIEDGKYTFCLYLTPVESIINNGCSEGNFFIKIPNQKYIICIEPNINRCISFPSNYIHKGTGYDKCNCNLRICVAWKFGIIDTSN